MAVTLPIRAGSPQFSQQIDRIMKSHSLRGSESLCRLLQYIAEQSLEHPEASLKEYQIAIDVYGRGTEFDPQSDSLVRVQAGRLRHKLAEYYANEGAKDPVVVSIPRGSYHLVFEDKQPKPSSAIEPSTNPPVLPSGIPPVWRFALVALSTCLLVSLLVAGNLLWGHKRMAASTGSAHESPNGDAPLADFWRPFTSATEEPWVIFSNASFVGRPETGMPYYNAREDSKGSVFDHYTGVGEVLAVHSLDEVFAGLGRHIRVKRGSL